MGEIVQPTLKLPLYNKLYSSHILVDTPNVGANTIIARGEIEKPWIMKIYNIYWSDDSNGNSWNSFYTYAKDNYFSDLKWVDDSRVEAGLKAGLIQGSLRLDPPFQVGHEDNLKGNISTFVAGGDPALIDIGYRWGIEA